ncbi:MAG: signal recognition particle-docking protein FtsY [Candidatus Diapherotrites archaeon]|nr:signal recognition particle-docking protein FtsY [Candidatus Diapherotrites archaeon]
MFNLLKKKLGSFVNKVKKKTTKASKESAKESKELTPKLSIKTKLKAAITKQIEISESELVPLLEELELSLIEADVEQNTAEKICNEIKERLLNKKIPAKDVEKFIKNEIREIIKELISVGSFDLIEIIKGKKEKPFKILFLGPNGSGKTTTIAKIAYLLKERGMSSIMAAADTFRAASIEQLAEHAEKLGVRIVKHQYNADPAAVAFDAVKAAEANKIDVVLIDSAGRQETNRNLIEELKKISRVVQPDLKIFVGETIAGQNLLQQAREFDEALNLDAFILTKLDCDAKGGTLISLLYNLKKPVLFIGVGQSYEDLIKFDEEEIVNRII